MRLFKLTIPVSAFGIICLVNSTLVSAQTKAEELKTPEDKAAYSIGYNVGQSLLNGGLKVDIKTIAKGLTDAFAGNESPLDQKDRSTAIREYAENAEKMVSQNNITEAKEFFAKNGKRKEVKTTKSGIQYEVLKEGTGASPKATDEVTVHYHGTLLNGTVFDSSVERKQPATFPLNGVIKGWTEGVQLMKTGAKYKFYIPSNLAYGENPRPGGAIKANAALVFEIELIKVGK